MTHSFDGKLACLVGVNGAVVLNHIAFWVQKNKAAGKNIADGKHWTFGSLKSFVAIFPYWTAEQIRYCIKSLTDSGYLVVGHHGGGWDRTAWYTLGEKAEGFFGFSVSVEADSCGGENGSPRAPQSRHLGNSTNAPPFGNFNTSDVLKSTNVLTTDIVPDIKNNISDRKRSGEREESDLKLESQPVTSKPKKKRLGTVNGSKPTIDEVCNFCKEIGLPPGDGEYMFYNWEGKGWKGVKNWMATIRSWRAAGYLPSQKAFPKNSDAPKRVVVPSLPKASDYD